MANGKWTLKTQAKRLAFEDRYIPNGFVLRESNHNEDPFMGNYIDDFPKGEYPIYTSFFLGAGLTLPLNPLLVEFLRETRLHICQLTPNTIRIILGTVKLNKRFNLHLGLRKLKYCYCLTIHEDDKWNLRAMPHSPSLIDGLSTFHKGYYKDVITITGVVEPDPVNNPVPKQFGSPDVLSIIFYFLLA